MASAWDGSDSNRGDEDSFASRDDNNGKRRSKSSDLETKKKRSKTLTLRRKRNSQTDNDSQPVEPSWKRTIKQKLPSRLRRARGHGIPDPRPSPDDGNCVCTSYRRTEDHFLGPGIVFSASQPPSQRGLLDFSKFNPNDYPTEDLDELRYQQRLAEMDAGIELSNNRTALTSERTDGLASSFDRQCTITSESVGYPNLRDVTSTPFSDHSSETIYSDYEPRGDCGPTVVHTQIDYIHCLVPDLEKVTNCGYYWGVMDRYEAESLLDNKPEGTFLLRDSAQDEFLFSVSFRRYGRSLHARIEQWNHKFSFDSHDPAVFASDTVHGLIEHYKDPGSCLFFEPMLIYPLNRTHVFSLQNLCRAVICSNVCYDGINYLNLPKSLKESLRYYHYKQKVRVRKFEISHV